MTHGVEGDLSLPLTEPARARLAAQAAWVIARNEARDGDAVFTRPAPSLYPHQWSWDAAFVAVGLSRVSPARAAAEIDALLRGQWRTGMLPHIVYASNAGGYFPDARRWACSTVCDDAPRSPATSGICQPPVHALAVERVVDAARADGLWTPERADGWAHCVYPRLLRWHRYLASYRDPEEAGLLVSYHSWETGMDNSPRWDGPFARVLPGPLPAYQRQDVDHVTDGAQRPSDLEYDRYLWLVEELKRARYDDERARAEVSFCVADVFASALFVAANEALARLAVRLGAPDAAELDEYAARFRAGVLASVDPVSGLARDVDLRAGAPTGTPTIAGFAPLICGGMDNSSRTRLVDLLLGPGWAGNPDFRRPLPPSAPPDAPGFDQRCYWRGPTWPVVTWLLASALGRHGETAAASRLRSAALGSLADGAFGEYYDPFTGEPLGSRDQSWTAAVVLDWLT